MPSTPITTLNSNNTPSTEPVRVTIVLTEPPTTRYYAALHAEAAYSAADISRAVAGQLVRIHQQQEEVIKVVTAPPIAGKVVLRMQSALNAIVVTVSASHLPKLRALPDVKGIYRDEVLNHDSSAPTSNISG